jgi:hypothetical protein
MKLEKQIGETYAAGQKAGRRRPPEPRTARCRPGRENGTRAERENREKSKELENIALKRD